MAALLMPDGVQHIHGLVLTQALAPRLGPDPDTPIPLKQAFFLTLFAEKTKTQA